MGEFENGEELFWRYQRVLRISTVMHKYHD